MSISANNFGKRLARIAGDLAFLGGLLTSSCAVGPNFKPPAAPELERYAPETTLRPLEADGAVQTLGLGQNTDPEWWRLFGSSDLNALVAQGLKNSPTLASARAALTQSEALTRAGAGVFFPSATGLFAVSRERTSPAEVGGTGGGATFSLYTLAGAVTYAVDLFGGERRALEGLRAQAEYQRSAVGAAFLLLTGDIADAAIARAGYAEQAGILTQIVELDAAQRDALKAQYAAGYGALASVLLAEQQLAADRQSLASAEQRRQSSTTLLKTLIGAETGAAAPALPDLKDFKVPSEAPVSLPSQLVSRRPDILQAQASLHQASAQVGVATAALFPSINITGEGGAVGSALASLGEPQARIWSVGPSIDVPIFRGGALWFNRKAAKAALVKAEADYRQTVLSALEQVADQLKALDADAQTAAANRAAVDAANLNGELGEKTLNAGVIAGYDEMTLKIQTGRALLGLMAARSQRLQDIVGLYVATGGGWTASGAEAPAPGASAK